MVIFFSYAKRIVRFIKPLGDIPSTRRGNTPLPADAAARNARARIDRRRAQTALLTPPQVALS